MTFIPTYLPGIHYISFSMIDNTGTVHTLYSVQCTNVHIVCVTDSILLTWASVWYYHFITVTLLRGHSTSSSSIVVVADCWLHWINCSEIAKQNKNDIYNSFLCSLFIPLWIVQFVEMELFVQLNPRPIANYNWLKLVRKIRQLHWP